MDIEDRFRQAVEHFWASRDTQLKAQVSRGRSDTGSRGAVTGGTQMGA